MPGALLGGVLIGLTEAIAGLFFTPSAKSMFAFAILVLVLLFRPQGILGKRACMMRAAARRRSAPRPGPAGGRCSRSCCAAPLARQRLPAHRPDPDPLFRLYRPGLEHHDGLCRAAVARPRALCRARRLYGGGALRAFRHRPVDRLLGRDPSPSRRPAARSSAFSRSASASAGVYFAILTIAFAEFARIGFDHFDLGRRLGRPVPAGRELCPQRPLEPARQADRCSTT